MMPHTQKTVAITGGTGFIGKALVTYFSTHGWNVLSLEREPTQRTTSTITHRSFELARAQDLDLSHVDVLIHTAYQPIIGKTERPNINMSAARTLSAQAKKSGTKVIFFSTLSAHKDATSVYGKTKLQMENMFDPGRDLILRFGLVLGRGGGLFGRISHIIKNATLVPLIGGSRQIQIISLDDVCRITGAGIEKDIHGIYDIAHPEVITLKKLYTEMARCNKRFPIFLSVPIMPVFYALLIAESLNIKLPFTSENVLGLRCLRAFDTSSVADTFGFTLKNYEETLSELS